MSDWKPIETLPHNILYFLGIIRSGALRVVERRGAGKFHVAGTASLCKPTHWMPLPEPPK